jgi:DMSO/TMAO reductase YedYZ molybdopterin-dependent catalytic subunit
MKRWIFWGIGGLVLILASCARSTAPDQAATPRFTPTPCDLEPIVVPTRPAEVPGYTELDPATGLHMTGHVPTLDFDSYRLVVTGTVETPLSLTYDDLRCMPKIELECTLVCPGFFQDEAIWAGAPLAQILEMAGAPRDAAGLRLMSADGYGVLATAEMGWAENSFLAYEWEGEPLPILHGFPVRAVFPDSSGNFWVKWLVRIEVLDEVYSPPGANPWDDPEDPIFR